MERERKIELHICENCRCRNVIIKGNGKLLLLCIIIFCLYLLFLVEHVTGTEHRRTLNGSCCLLFVLVRKKNPHYYFIISISTRPTTACVRPAYDDNSTKNYILSPLPNRNRNSHTNVFALSGFSFYAYFFFSLFCSCYRLLSSSLSIIYCFRFSGVPFPVEIFIPLAQHSK